MLTTIDQTITTLMFPTVDGNLQPTGSRMLEALLAKLQRRIATEIKYCILLDRVSTLRHQLNATHPSLQRCHQAQRNLVNHYLSHVCMLPMWKWQHLCKTGCCVCEIDCSVFSDTKSLRKARQAPLGQIRPSGRNRSLCHAHKSLSQE